MARKKKLNEGCLRWTAQVNHKYKNIKCTKNWRASELEQSTVLETKRSQLLLQITIDRIANCLLNFFFSFIPPASSLTCVRSHKVLFFYAGITWQPSMEILNVHIYYYYPWILICSVQVYKQKLCHFDCITMGHRQGAPHRNCLSSTLSDKSIATFLNWLNREKMHISLIILESANLHLWYEHNFTLYPSFPRDPFYIRKCWTLNTLEIAYKVPLGESSYLHMCQAETILCLNYGIAEQCSTYKQ